MAYIARAAALKGFPDLVRELGGNPSELLRQVGLSTAVLHDADLYVPYTALARLYTLAARRCEEPAFGVRLGNRQGLEILGALGSALCLQNTVGEALNLIRRNLDFHARGITLLLEHDASSACIAMEVAFQQEVDCVQLIALSLAMAANGLTQLHNTGQTLLQAELRMAQPLSTEAYHEAFRCPVLFGQPRNCLRFDAALLDLPVNSSTELRERLNALWQSGSAHHQAIALPDQVEQVINALLPTGDCSLDMVARLLELQPRTLQLHLRRAHVSYSDILQRARMRLACEHLRHGRQNITDLALSLGFSETAVFSRAFKAWTGATPRQWRSGEH